MPAVGPADSALRSKENVVVRGKFGTSSSDFRCRYDLLEDMDDGATPQLKITTERQTLQRKYEIAKATAEAWKYKTAAARLKLARLNSNTAEVRAQMAAQIEVARCDLKVKEIENKISKLKDEEAARKVESARKIEDEQMKLMPDLTDTLQKVQNFDAIMKDPDRKVYFFSYCKQEGHAPWYCGVLDKRKDWYEYPSIKWFITQKGTQLHCPLRNIMMDYSDQHVYSRAAADIKGNEWITDKGLLAKMKLPFTPNTYHIRECQWQGDTPPRLPPGAEKEGDAVYFVKDTLRNYSTGIYLAHTAEGCIKISEEKNAYVVQPQINPYLIDGKKNHFRIYFLMYSPKGSTDVRFFQFREGYLAVALKEYDPTNLDRDVQVTRDRTMRMSEWDEYPEFLPLICETLCGLANAVKPKLQPTKEKSHFMISGLDLMLDVQKTMWLLEANAGPVVRGADQPCIKAMIDLCVPEGSGFDPETEIVGKWWFELLPTDDKAALASHCQAMTKGVLKALTEAKAQQKAEQAEEAADGPEEKASSNSTEGNKSEAAQQQRNAQGDKKESWQQAGAYR